jgi:hypothetical protein
VPTFIPGIKCRRPAATQPCAIGLSVNR